MKQEKLQEFDSSEIIDSIIKLEIAPLILEELYAQEIPFSNPVGNPPIMDYTTLEEVIRKSDNQEAAKLATAQAIFNIKLLQQRHYGTTMPLIFASAKGYLEVLNLLLGAIDSSFIRINTAQICLAPATTFNHSNICKRLLELDVDVNRECDNKCNTPLLIAIRNHNIDLCALLIKAGADPDVMDFDGFTALHLAYVLKQYDIVLLLIYSGADIHREIDTYGTTLLHLAAQEDNQIVCQALIDAGENTHKYDQSRRNPLDCAITQGSVYAAKVLILAGATPSKSVKAISSKPQHLHKLKIAEIEAFLAKHRQNCDKMRLLLKHDQVKALKSLDLAPIYDDQGKGLLHYAAEYDAKKSLEYLLSILPKFCIERKCHYGCTALKYAADYGHIGSCKILLHHEAQISDMDHFSPRHSLNDNNTGLAYIRELYSVSTSLFRDFTNHDYDNIRLIIGRLSNNKQESEVKLQDLMQLCNRDGHKFIDLVDDLEMRNQIYLSLIEPTIDHNLMIKLPVIAEPEKEKDHSNLCWTKKISGTNERDALSPP